MILNDLFENKLMELRRNPTVNSKQAFTDDLQKYAGRNDIFVSFTSDVGKKTHSVSGSSNTSGHKIGINPRTEYDTPIGIYSYPVDYVLSLKGKVPFAGEQPFIQVLELASDDIIDLDTYTWDDFDEDSEKLVEYLRKFKEGNKDLFKPLKYQQNQEYFDRLKQIQRFEKPDRIIQSAVTDSLIKTPGGALWNFTRMVANIISKALKPDFQSQDLSQNAVALWNKVFRMLGYDGAIDHGKGIIHEAEPTQAIFFSIKSIKLVETLRNINPQTGKSTTAIAIEKPNLFLKWLYGGKLNLLQISTIIYSSMARGSNIEWDKLPDFIKMAFQHNYKKWIIDHPALFSIIPLTDEQIIEILQEKPLLLLYGKNIFKPKVIDYLSDQFFSNKEIGDYIDKRKYEIPFTPQQIVNIFNHSGDVRCKSLILGARETAETARFLHSSRGHWNEGIRLFSQVNPERYKRVKPEEDEF